MINRERSIVMDVDGTLCPIKGVAENYTDLLPYREVIDQLNTYKKNGFYIILFSSRNMNTFNGNVGRIAAVTGKQLMAWLDRHQIPYDELHLGKPWPGRGGFYVDDKAIRPNEFLKLSYDEILRLTGDAPGGQ